MPPAPAVLSAVSVTGYVLLLFVALDVHACVSVCSGWKNGDGVGEAEIQRITSSLQVLQRAKRRRQDLGISSDFATQPLLVYVHYTANKFRSNVVDRTARIV